MESSDDSIDPFHKALLSQMNQDKLRRQAQGERTGLTDRRHRADRRLASEFPNCRMSRQVILMDNPHRIGFRNCRTMKSVSTRFLKLTRFVGMSLSVVPLLLNAYRLTPSLN